MFPLLSFVATGHLKVYRLRKIDKLDVSIWTDHSEFYRKNEYSDNNDEILILQFNGSTDFNGYQNPRVLYRKSAMSAKLSLLVTFSAIIFCFGIFPTLAMAQTSPDQNPYYQSGVASASYNRQDRQQDATTQNLIQTIERMELRLRELEQDGQNEVDSQPDAKEQADDSTKNVAERLEELEEGFEKQGEAVEKLEDAVPGFVVHGHKSPKLKFFGRIHADYWAFPNVAETLYPLELGGNPQDRINFRRLRLGVSGDLTDNMMYKFEGEYAGGVDPSYRDAFLGFKNLPFLRTVIIGNHKRPYGLDHLNSSRHNVFIERPFIVEAFNQDSRRIGMSSNGFTEDQGWNWRFGVWNQELTQTKSGYIGDHYQLEIAARLARTAWYDESSGGRGYAHFALSGSAGTPNGNPGSINNQARYRTRPEARTNSRWLDTGRIVGANTNYLWGFESAINIGSFNWTSEFLQTKIDRINSTGPNVSFNGFYTQFSYLLTGEHHPWNRERGTLDRLKPFENFFLVRDCDCQKQAGWGAFELAFRYSHADLNDDDILGGEADSYTMAMNWYWNPYARMQFNYILGDVHSGRDAAGQGEYQVAGVRMMVDF